MSARARRVATVAVALLAGTSVACTPQQTRLAGRADFPVDDRPRELRLDFEGGAGTPGAVLAGVSNRGTHPVVVDVTTEDGGRVLLDEGVPGTGARFPGLGEDGAAAVVVRSQGGRDRLSPGLVRFAFGADFALDAESDGTGTDDGDNLLQRGLFADGSQLKLQVDHGVVSCRVAGDRGAVTVSARSAVERERWYRASCSRHGRRLVLALARARPDRTWSPPSRVSAVGRIGAVVFDPAVPVAVGAKVLPGGVIAASDPDQFNGAVDNVYVDQGG
ncbi:hypothetical protein [Nocardioides sp. Arc9.136]|uniref:hypothetical protein n=1 Tax=Nocardioides sp. Arc9.136 TaxID=2996826 RepID=UPI002665346B|nr:hypothetical protein [Nocardioides sp. Arc9.136]WKN46986.1 hypothetical protein OSR43_13160 [Nocardioides sp. Arc9.136]